MNPEDSIPAVSIKRIDQLALTNQNFIDLMTAILSKGYFVRFKARGISMHPFIRNGDIITLSPLNNTSLKPGQVVAFTNPETEMVHVHRIIKVGENKYLIKGDNVGIPDGLINRSKIFGVVSRVEREGKNVNFMLNFWSFFWLTHRNFFKKIWYRLFRGKKHAA